MSGLEWVSMRFGVFFRWQFSFTINIDINCSSNMIWYPIPTIAFSVSDFLYSLWHCFANFSCLLPLLSWENWPPVPRRPKRWRRTERRQPPCCLDTRWTATEVCVVSVRSDKTHSLVVSTQLKPVYWCLSLNLIRKVLRCIWRHGEWTCKERDMKGVCRQVNVAATIIRNYTKNEVHFLNLRCDVMCLLVTHYKCWKLDQI